MIANDKCIKAKIIHRIYLNLAIVFIKNGRSLKYVAAVYMNAMLC